MQIANRLNGQRKRLNIQFKVFGRAEVRELRRLLKKGELVQHCVYGYYHGGFGILVATNYRILLVDKRLFYLILEDISYQNVRSIELSSQLLQGTLYIHTGLRKIVFKRSNDLRLKEIRNFISDRVDETQESKVTSNIVRSAMRSYLSREAQPEHQAIMKHAYPTKFYPST